jgi:hypothetical protein
MAEGGANNGGPLPGLNPEAPAFSMDGLIAAAASLQRNCRLPDFVIEKPEAWFKCVEAQLEDVRVTKPKDRYNKVLGKLPVNIIEELAPVTDDPSAYADPYKALKEHLLAAYGRSKWEKMDSLLASPKMGAHERPSVVLARLNTLKPATLEELYIAIYLRVLPDGYREHFSRCKFQTAEELAAVADGLWEMRGGNPAVVAAVGRSASPGRHQSPLRQQQQQHRGGDGSGGYWRGGGCRNRGNGSRGGFGGGSGRRDCSPTPGGALQNGGSGSTGGGGGGRGLHDGAHVGSGICFHHYTYGRSATRCKPPCLFSQGNGAAASGD